MKEDDVMREVVEDIVEHFSDGQLISHDWLRKRCGIEPLMFEDYESVSDFIEAYQMQQFQYMNIVDSIRTLMLKEYNCYFKNDRGAGYIILDPKDQVSFGYDRFVDGLKKLMKETNLIMNNVRAVGNEQQSKDNDLRAKYAAMKMMLETIKK